MAGRNSPSPMVLVCLAVCVVALAEPLLGQFGILKKDKEDKGTTEKEQQFEEKEEKRRAEQAKKFATVTQYAEAQYTSDPEFREAVDKAYLELQGEQALQAFQINTAETVQLVREGDVLKVRRSLYDNPRVQEYVNRVGQGLVPTDSQKLYAFKLFEYPIPTAFTLSSGSIYISTGLVSLTDSEAQLAYILSHELAHIYKDHWKLKVRDALAEEEYNRARAKKRAIWGTVIGAAAGGIAGGLGGSGASGAALMAAGGAMFGITIAQMFARKIDVDWEAVREDEADDFALKNTLGKNYDVQEIPKLYLAMTRAVSADERVGFGFMGNPKRVKERGEHVQGQLASSLQAQYQEKLKAGQLVGATSDYQLMMGELRRDNGIKAFYYDMFDMARQNLRQAVNLRSDDARARYYYGKVLKLVARTDADTALARRELLAAIELDRNRHTIPEAELQRALMLMDSADSRSQAEAIEAVKSYILGYQDKWKHASSVPPNMEILYDYLRLLGEQKWKPPFPEYNRTVATDLVTAGAAPALGPASVPGTGSTPVVPAQAQNPPK